MKYPAFQEGDSALDFELQGSSKEKVKLSDVWKDELV